MNKDVIKKQPEGEYLCLIGRSRQRRNAAFNEYVPITSASPST